jgi:hypothetical protein
MVECIGSSGESGWLWLDLHSILEANLGKNGLENYTGNAFRDKASRRDQA